MGLVAIGLTLALTAALTVGACGGGQTRGHPLDSSWGDEDGEELAEFQKGFRFDVRPKLVQVAVGVVDSETLIGRALDSEHRWRFSHPLEGRPVIAGSIVLAMGDEQLFALDAETGELLWERPAVGQLRGASDDGATTLVSIESLSGRKSTVLAIDRSGTVQRQLFLKAAIGRPLVVDAYAFLPYNRKIVLVFDLLEGTEAARIVADFPVSHAFRIGDEIYFGESTAVRFDEAIVAARTGGGHRVSLPDRDFPRRPAWHLPGSMAPPLIATRDDTVRYYARPVVVDGEAVIDRYALSYFSLVLGLEAPSGQIRWIHRGDAIYLGGWAGHRSLAVCDAAGDLRWLDGGSGAVVHRDTLGQAVLACVVQSEGPPDRLVPAPPPPRVEQLFDALTDQRAELEPIQTDLLAELDAIGDEDATRALSKLAAHDSPASDQMAREARDLLAKRHRSVDTLVELLVEDERRPPLATSSLPLVAIARALGRSQRRTARAALAERLGDPTLVPRQAIAVAEAIEQLTQALDGEPTADTEIKQRLVRYLAAFSCPAPPRQPSTLAVARTLLMLGARDIVTAAARRPCDRDGMKASLQAVVDGHPLR